MINEIQNKTLKGVPTKTEGVDGDLTLRTTLKGIALFGKIRNTWYKLSNTEYASRSGKQIKKKNLIKQNISVKDAFIDKTIKIGKSRLTTNPTASFVTTQDTDYLNISSKVFDVESASDASTLAIGDISLQPTWGTTGAAITLAGGNGDGDPLYLKSAAGGGTNGDGGNLILSSGNRAGGGGSGVTGNVIIGAGNAGTINATLLDINATSTTMSGILGVTGTITAGGFTTTGTITMSELTDDAAIGITKIQDSGTSFTDNDTSIMTAAAIADKIESYSYSTTTGDITGVTLTGDSGGALADTAGSADFTIAGGTNATSVGSGSTITINVDDAFITNNAADIMAVSDFGANAALKIDADQPATAGAEDSKGLWIDYDRIVAGSGTANHHDIGIDLDVNTASLGTSSVKGIDIDVVGATSGTHIAYGMTVNVSGSDSNLGILSNVTNGGIDFKCLSSANIGDYFMLQTLANGETTLATVDADASLAHINLIADGEIRLNAKDFGPTDGIQFLADGTQIADFTAHHNYSELRLYENMGASTNDFVTLQSHANGAGILQTIDVAGTAAHLSLEPDGDLIFDSNTQNIYTKDASDVLNPIVKTHTVSFTEAEVNNFHSAPQVLLAAQGANKVIVPTSMMLFVTRDGSTAQSNSSCDLTIGYDGAVGPGHISYYARRFMYNESGSRIIRVVGGFGNDVGQSLTEGDDADLTIAVDSAVTSGSIDAIKAVFSYYVFDNS